MLADGTMQLTWYYNYYDDDQLYVKYIQYCAPVYMMLFTMHAHSDILTIIILVH